MAVVRRFCHTDAAEAAYWGCGSESKLLYIAFVPSILHFLLNRYSMRAFDFDFHGQTFQATFRNGHIFYKREDLTSVFKVEPGGGPKELTAAEGQNLLPPDKQDMFRSWHHTAQNALFEVIRFDNEID